MGAEGRALGDSSGTWRGQLGCFLCAPQTLCLPWMQRGWELRHGPRGTAGPGAVHIWRLEGARGEGLRPAHEPEGSCRREGGPWGQQRAPGSQVRRGAAVGPAQENTRSGYCAPVPAVNAQQPRKRRAKHRRVRATQSACRQPAATLNSRALLSEAPGQAPRVCGSETCKSRRQGT